MTRSKNLVLALSAAGGALAQSSARANITTTISGLPSYTGLYEASVFSVGSGTTVLNANCPSTTLDASATSTIDCTEGSFRITLDGSTSFVQTSTSTDSINQLSTNAIMTSSCSILPSSTVRCTVTGSTVTSGSTVKAAETTANVQFDGAATFIITAGQQSLPVTTTSTSATSTSATASGSPNAAPRAVVFAPGVSSGFFATFVAAGVSTLILAAVL